MNLSSTANPLRKKLRDQRDVSIVTLASFGSQTPSPPSNPSSKLSISTELIKLGYYNGKGSRDFSKPIKKSSPLAMERISAIVWIEAKSDYLVGKPVAMVF
ncbi:hypothetical protein L6452_00841 [Arctium lappa]|uniref:Uncharacterized protein n=1 Tax=Arctium lappa TaxID=4217 RepID=A0ACB9FG01_ARCLA|nr:hypothetical protein L6452_00841 [Arctium lappa]